MVTVTFRCKRSGNTIKFSDPEAIAELREHQNYEEVKNEIIEQKTDESTEQEDTEQEEVLKRPRGRPKKQ